MKINGRPILAYIIILTISLINFSYSFAQDYQWKDITEPFQRAIKVRISEEVEVVLPEYILNDFKELELIVTSDGLGRYFGFSKRGLLKINGASSWKGYTIKGHSTSAEQALNKIKIATKDLRAGSNLFEFTNKQGNQYSGHGYKITELRFNIPNLKEIQARHRKNDPPSPTKAQKPFIKTEKTGHKEQQPIQKKAGQEPQLTQIRSDESNSKTSPKKQLLEAPTNKQTRQIRKNMDELAEVKSLESTLTKTKRIYLQHALKELDHYRGKVDGAFGPGTRSAIKAYQQNLDKPVTGYLEKSDISTLTSLGKVVFEKAEVERKYREKEAKRIVEEEAKRKRQKDEARRLAQEKTEHERKEAEARRLAIEKAERERKEAEARRIAQEEFEVKQKEAAAERKRQAEEARRLAAEKAEHERKEAEARRVAREAAERKQKEAAAAERKRQEEARRLAEEKAEFERQKEAQLKEALRAEIKKQLEVEIEREKRLAARSSKTGGNGYKFVDESVNYRTLDAEVGCQSRDSISVQNEKFVRRYKDKIFVLPGRVMKIEGNSALLDLDDGQPDISIDLIPGQDLLELEKKLVTIEFIMTKKGGCFSLFQGERGIVYINKKVSANGLSQN